MANIIKIQSVEKNDILNQVLDVCWPPSSFSYTGATIVNKIIAALSMARIQRE